MNKVMIKSLPYQVQKKVKMMESSTPIQKELVKIFQKNQQYEPFIISKLEDYVEEQLKLNQMDLLANLHLLQMYRLHPEKMNISKVAKVLIKALMSIGDASKSFTACQYLVSEETREDETIEAILEASELLESMKFKEFWQLRLTLAEKTPGFQESARAFIFEAIISTHSSIDVTLVQAYLNLSDTEVQQLIEAQKWTMKNKNYVEISSNASNQFRAKKFKENIEVSNVLKTIYDLER